MTSQLKLICAAVALASAGPVLGATSWTLTGTPTAGVTIGAYANTGGIDDTAGVASNAATQTIEAATWNSSYGGIKNADAPGTQATGLAGATCEGRTYTSGGNTYWSSSKCDQIEGDNPEHAIDNEQRYDMALLTFTSSVKLTDVTIGWPSGTSGYDTDITVMAYTGPNPFNATGANSELVGLTYDQLIGKGWANVGNYSDLVQGVAKTINGGGLVSSYWLIGAYNPLANPSGGSVTIPGTGSPYDYIKLASVGGTYCTPGTPGCGGGPSSGTIPEPKSSQLALLGVGLLLGTMWMRRRARSR